MRVNGEDMKKKETESIPPRLARWLCRPVALRLAVLGAALGIAANAVSGLPMVGSLSHPRGPATEYILVPVVPVVPPAPMPSHRLEGGTLTVGPVTPPNLTLELQVEKGDTLMEILLGQGIARRDAYAAITALTALVDPKRIRPGQALTLNFGPSGPAEDRLEAVTMSVSYDRDVSVRRAGDDGFVADLIEKELSREGVRAGGVIQSSLLEAGIAADVPMAVMIELIRAYSFDVDFQRDIQKGDSFDLVFERYFDDRGREVHNGGILYATLTLSGNTMRVYRYEATDGEEDYFDKTGASVRKALLRTPIDGARISSRFGKRKHPILGYNKIHQGIDFAASAGTPVMAAGNGVIEVAGRNGAYGNYVRIRHKGSYATAYAHLNKFGRGITTGGRVKQGQIIGYVGSTGRSTGAHLHYEVLRDGRQVNPQKVKMPSGRKLEGEELALFQAVRESMDALIASLPLEPALASR
jgi:murein DD-endopeptidase MepM/ murein hydrolase activator NlpD